MQRKVIVDELAVSKMGNLSQAEGRVIGQVLVHERHLVGRARTNRL